MKNRPFEKLVKSLNIGHGELASKFGISRQALYKWRDSYIPPDRALEVERLSNGEVTSAEVMHYAHGGSWTGA
jgi:transposase-like protein